ncbi:helix-turn-helix domain-containing protein [Aquibacillus kalidii]|uniref:helix-turn-helix domain-containing protein n=1 Tax=Aquibacillus kalidii TaxID=2762597 RepID=UPI00164589FC|nr:helix-turn-helix domain-containing protein [Aquibacillus kalidii]
MNQQTVTESVSAKLKLIRVEKGYTQDRMSSVLGISKKTLVQIEKGRVMANWTTVVAICALFRNSEVIHNILGGDGLEAIETIAHNYIEEAPKDKTMGGKVWWKQIKFNNGYTLQQNVISQHYRIIDEENNRMYSCLEREEAELKLLEIAEALSPS